MDSDDKLIYDHIGINENHEKKIRERLLQKRFLSYYSNDNIGPRYHYTSPQGLIGILKTRTFFFTDSQFLNDFRERININDELEEYWRWNNRKYDKRFVKLLKEINVTRYEDDGFSYLDGDRNEICRYFVLSLSQDGDCLSMWKYYSKAENYNGYSLGIFSMALVDEWIDRTTGVAIVSSPIIYHSEEKQGIIKQTIDELYTIWQSYELSEELDQKIRKEYYSWLSCLALFFKDKCFEDERETRYVAVVPNDRLKDLFYEYNGQKYKMYDFRIVNGVLVPYIKMPFNGWNGEECWAINSIRVGPSGNAEQKIAGLKQFVQSLDYTFGEECKILSSNVPVRY